MDLYKHVMLAGIFSGHAQDLGGFTFPERRDDALGVTDMSATERSGHFGGSHWTWSAKWGDHLRRGLVQPH